MHVVLHATQLFAGTFLGRLQEPLELVRRWRDRVGRCLRVLVDGIQTGVQKWVQACG